MSESAIAAIQQNVARYGLSTLLIMGNFGNLFTILILNAVIKTKSQLMFIVFTLCFDIKLDCYQYSTCF